MYLHISIILFCLCIILGLAQLLRLQAKKCKGQENLDKIIQAAPFAMVVVNARGEITQANPKAESILGIQQDSITKRTYSAPEWLSTDLDGKPLSPEQLPVSLAFQTEKPILNFKHITTRPEGSKILLSVSAIPLRDSTGKVEAVLATFEDITEQEALRTSLVQSENRFRNLFENMTQGFALHQMIFDASGAPVDYEFLAVNPAFTDLTGIQAATLIGKTVKEIMPHIEDYWIQTYGKVASTGIPMRYENYSKELDRTYDTFTFSPERGKFAVMFSDVSEKKKALQELEARTEEMARFTYMVSHDLKTPLITIKSFTNYLYDDMERQDTEAIKKDLNFIQKASEKMSTLLDEVLQISRVGRVQNEPEEFPLQTVFSEIQTIMAGRLNHSGIEVKWEIRPIILWGDRNRIVEVFQNLLENAIKYMGPQKQPLIEIYAETQDANLVFVVKDNGIGIDPKFKHRIFGLFDKLDAKSEGSGLGLALVKRILDVHQGKIWLESEGIDTGCTFKFTLPKARFA